MLLSWWWIDCVWQLRSSFAVEKIQLFFFCGKVSHWRIDAAPCGRFLRNFFFQRSLHSQGFLCFKSWSPVGTIKLLFGESKRYAGSEMMIFLTLVLFNRPTEICMSLCCETHFKYSWFLIQRGDIKLLNSAGEGNNPGLAQTHLNEYFFIIGALQNMMMMMMMYRFHIWSLEMQYFTHFSTQVCLYSMPILCFLLNLLWRDAEINDKEDRQWL